MEREKALWACVLLGRSYGFDEAHSRQDARLALRLFDLLAEVDEVPEEERDVLHCAALVHDIGYVEGYEGHHKTAYRLIMEANLPGLDDREKQLVANIARYHRGSEPDRSHPGFAALASRDRDAVVLLSAILCLADGLDRSHCDAVRDLEVRVEGNRLVVLVDCPLGCSAETWAGEKKGRLLGRALGVRVEVRERSGTVQG